MNKGQFETIMKWQDETFPHANAYSKVMHLKEEIEELSIDVATDGLGMNMEFADCCMLLFGVASKCGLSYEDCCNAIDEKMSINRKTKWGNPDVNGVVKHIEDMID